jgi:hypothetical protein
MTGYVVVAAGWQKKPDATRAWIVTALSWSRALPAKAPKAKKKPPTLTLPRKGGGKLRGKS